MANKTQMRLQQLTGSLVDLAYSGSQSSAGAASSLVQEDLGGVLGQFAGAIGRIQGKTSDFTNQAEGVFNYTGADFNLDTNQAVTIDGGTGVSIDATTGNANLSTAEAASSVTLAAAGGSTNKVIVSSAGTGADAIDINATAGGLDADVAGAINIATTGAAGEISLVSAHTAGLAFHIDANANAASEVQIDAGILDVDITGAGTIDAGSGLSLDAGAASNFSTSAGNLTVHAASSAILSGSLVTVMAGAGDLTVDSPSARLLLTGSGGIEMASATGDVKISTAEKIEFGSSKASADAIAFNAAHGSGGIDLQVASAVKVSLDANSLDVSSGVIVNIDDTTASTSTSTGALVVDGGVGVAGDLNVGGEIVLTDGLDVSGLTTLRGDLQVLGTTTTVSSSNTEFADAVLGLNYSGSQTGPNRDVGFILGRDGGNMAFVYDNSASAFVLGATNNNPDDATVAFSSWKDLHLANVQVGSGSATGAIQSGDGTAALSISNDAVRVTVNDKLRIDGGVIEDSNGDTRVAFSDGGDLTLRDDGGSVAVTVNGANSNVSLEADLEVKGGKVTLSNGATIDSETAGELILTEDLVKASGDLQVAGNDIKDSNGDVVMTMSGDGQKKLTLAGPLAIPSNMSASFNGDAFQIKEDGSNNGQLTVANGNLNLAADGSGYVSLDAGSNEHVFRGTSVDFLKFEGDGSDSAYGALQDGNGNRKVVFDSNSLILSTSNGDLKFVSDDGGSQLDIDMSKQNNTMKLPAGSSGLLFQVDGTDICYVNESGLELQGADDGSISFGIQNGAEKAFQIFSAKGYYGSLTGSHILQESAEGTGKASYLVVKADDVTGSVGNSMEGGLFLGDNGFDVKAESYSWSQGILFASGSSDYDEFIVEFGAEATLLSALSAGAGGSATRDDNVISSQVVAGSTTTLGADLSDVPSSSADTRVQVYVNGQLMLSGAAGNNDYTLVSYGASTNAQFQFNIEVDDVVSVLAK